MFSSQFIKYEREEHLVGFRLCETAYETQRLDLYVL